MPKEEAYLIRTPRGTMVTVMAYSIRGAADKYLSDRTYARGLEKGQHFTVKLRGGAAAATEFVVT